MRKLYSIVLMATALLIGTNAWANYDPSWLQAQFDTVHTENLVGTVTITMEDDITLTEPVYLGTKTVDEARKSIILDMNGHHITMSATDWVTSKGNVYCSMFTITHGELLVRNSDKTKTSLIQMTGKGYDNYNNIFNVAGSYKSSRWVKSGNDYVISESAAKNTRKEGWFTHLEIGEGVKLVAGTEIYGAGISMDGYYTLYHALVSPDAVTTYVFGGSKDNPRSAGALTAAAKNVCLYNRADAPAYNTAILANDWEGVAYGLRVDVCGDIEFASDAEAGKTYGIKINGGIKSSLKVSETFKNSNCWYMDEAYAKTYANAVKPTSSANKTYSVSGEYYENHKLDTIDAPFLYVHSSAHIVTAAEAKEATAVYCSGYGKTLIEGECKGKSGVNIKSGTIELHDAVIESTAKEYDDALAGNHATGSGGIIVNSVDGRAGGIEVVISGDTKVSTTVGYAIEETVNKTKDNETNVSSITIKGGTIESADKDKGAIALTVDGKNATEVTGGNINGDASVDGNTVDVSTLLPDNANFHTTEVTVDGKTTIVVSQGPAPTGKTLEEAIAAYNAWVSADKTGDSISVKLTGAISEADGKLEANYEFKELELNADVAQILTVAAGYTLKVGRVVLGENAQIIVEPGATFIVYGSQGIVAPVVDNIVLKASETDQAVFLFNPDVTSNRHPNATVQMYAKAHHATDGTWFSQHFGIPTFETPAVTWAPGDTYVYKFEESGWVNITSLSELKPFIGYRINNTSASAAGVYTFKGKLNGNTDAPLEFAKTYYNLVANSYAAPMALSAVFADLKAQYGDAVELSAWIYKSDEDRHVSVTKAGVDNDEDPTAIKTIAPMQGFILNCGAAKPAKGSIDYTEAIWNNPNKTGVAIMAPARRAEDNSVRATIIVSTEKSKDQVVLRESDEYSSAFDNGADAHKYMSERVFDLYSENDGQNYSDVATDNLEGTTLTLKAKAETAYTMSFRNVNNFNYVVRDNLSGAIIPVEEGTTYDFYMAEGTTANGRFEIVGRQNMPTAIENIEAVKSAKGVYTILGQYLGESNILNTLPSGIYVVDGQRIVK